MDHQRDYPDGSEPGTVERLAALQAAQDALWLRLRSATDPDQRMALLSEFSDNRSAIERLRAALSSGSSSIEGRNGSLSGWPHDDRDGTPDGLEPEVVRPLSFDQSGNLVSSDEPDGSAPIHLSDPDDLDRDLGPGRGPATPRRPDDPTDPEDHEGGPDAMDSSTGALFGRQHDRDRLDDPQGSADDEEHRWATGGDLESPSSPHGPSGIDPDLDLGSIPALGGLTASRRVDVDPDLDLGSIPALGGLTASRRVDVDDDLDDDIDLDLGSIPALGGLTARRRADLDDDSEADADDDLTDDDSEAELTDGSEAELTDDAEAGLTDDAEADLDGDFGPTRHEYEPGELGIADLGPELGLGDAGQEAGPAGSDDRGPSDRLGAYDYGVGRRAESVAAGALGVDSDPTPTMEYPSLAARRANERSTGESSNRILLVLGGVAAVLAVAWLLLNRPSDEAPTSAATEIVDETATVEPAGPTTDPRVFEIDAALAREGLPTVRSERRESGIALIGTVSAEAERERAVAVARAAAPDEAIDGSEIVIEASALSAPDPAAPTGRAAAYEAELNRIVAATPLIFEVGETAITELHARILNSIASIMAAYPGIPVTIVGYTDNTGSDESNRHISLERAESVRAYLVAQGIPEAELSIEARGEDTSSGSAALASLERRVEFEVSQAPAVPPAEAPPIRIAVVAPSARNDLAFTQSMVDAVNAISAERGNIEVAITDNTFVPEDAAAAIRRYAADDYDLVIAHGSQFGSAVLEIAPEFPEVAFAWGTASDTFGLDNVYAYDAAAEQGGYVMGAMSTMLSQTGVVGVVGPIEVGDAQRYVTGFQAGALLTKPDATVLVTYTGSFSDLTLAAEAARAHTASGADVLTGSAQMVVGAVSVASDDGALWFGTQADQSSLAPSLVVASQVYHWEVILRQIVGDIDAGALGGRTYTADIANGGLVVELNPGYELPDAVRQRAEEVTSSIRDGSTSVLAS